MANEPTVVFPVLPQHRPSSLDPEELGFTPREPVPWLGPVLLAVTGVRVAFAEQFGAYLDKRELQGAFPTKVYDEHAEDEEVWIDYISDLGDGFNATYSMAWLMAQKSLRVATPDDGRDNLLLTELPRGQILVMGGDQVYPTASGKDYEDRMVGPYLAAYSTPEHGETPPSAFALPGNHDWYDGLTAFLRLFARREGGHVGAWQTKQTRSYFALKLPHNWWLLAVDVQGEAYLDDPQLDYFRSVANLLGQDDKVIICFPQPSWVQTAAHPRGYDTLGYFRRKLIEPTGAQVKVMISGDLHHYARYAEQEAGGEHLITAGTGGAYLYATHGLPTKVTVPPRRPFAVDTQQQTFTLRTTYPSRRKSRALSAGIFPRLPWRNPGFATLLGIVHTLFLLSLKGRAHQLLSFPAFLMIGLMLAGSLFFAVGLSHGMLRRIPVILGLSHGIAHVMVGYAGYFAWRELPFDNQPWPWPGVLAFVIYGPVAGFVATQLVALYLFVAGAFRVNLNELFAGQGIEDYKGFLRMRIGADGALTIFPIGVDKVGRSWVPKPQRAASTPWLDPETPLKPKLIEEPIVIR
ncbi:MAG: metallophosphoesterase [Hamadaea sp.]|nr:metallophosphoesterase [Hamadaea sp.]